MHLIKNYSLLPATNADIKEIKSVIYTSLNEYGLKQDEDLNDIEKHYTLRNGFLGKIVLRTNPKVLTGKIVGTIGLLNLSEDICELRKMYLLKEHRGKGLDKILMDVILKMAKEKGYKKVELETASILNEAIRLYEKYGFREIDRTNLAKRCDKALMLELI